jgi:WD40 repeat protein
MRSILAHLAMAVLVSLPNTARSAAPELVVQIGHLGDIWSVAFSPDGKQVLTGSYDCTAILWDVETGTVLRKFARHKRPVESVAFSPDGKSILTGSWDTTAILWDPITGK